MNKNIAALIELATWPVYSTNPYNGAPEFEGYQIDNELLATLVAKECANIAKATNYMAGKAIEDYYGV